MDVKNRPNINIILAEPESQLRQGIRNAMAMQGYQSIRDFSRLDRVEQEVARDTPDLLVIDATMPGGDTCELVEKIRHRRIGDNPFLAIIVTIWNPGRQLVQRVVNSGADDLLVKPISPAQLMGRINALVDYRKPFLVTSDYIGPDRRKNRSDKDGAAEGEDEAESMLIDVPNTLRAKARGETIDPQEMQALIDQAMYQVNEQRLKRHSYQIAFLVNLIVPAYKENRYGPEIEAHIARLADIANDIGARLAGSSFEHVADLCTTLIDVADSIRKNSRDPNPKDVDLLKSLSDAILVGFNPEKNSAAVAAEITRMVRKFAARARAEALNGR